LQEYNMQHLVLAIVRKKKKGEGDYDEEEKK